MRRFLINVNLTVFALLALGVTWLTIDDLYTNKKRNGEVNQYLLSQSLNVSEKPFPSKKQKEQLDKLEVTNMKRTVKDNEIQYSYELYVPSVMNTWTKDTMSSSSLRIAIMNF